MIDLHCHLIYDTDDGSESLESTINMIKEAYNAGFKKICCTPHYLDGQYIKTKEENSEKLEIIKKEIEKENIDIELFLGNEIYIQSEIPELIEAGVISTMAETKYVLLEFPLMFERTNAEQIIHNLIIRGYNVILAHPERYAYVQKNIKYLDAFLEDGVYLQGNYGSLIGKYGTASKKILKKLLKERKITLLGSDNHRENSVYTQMDKILRTLKKYTDDEYFEKVTESNPEKILNNEII